MKLPRNVDGDELAHRLNRYGYRIDHQIGSHQRLSVVMQSSMILLNFLNGQLRSE